MLAGAIPVLITYLLTRLFDELVLLATNTASIESVLTLNNPVIKLIIAISLAYSFKYLINSTRVHLHDRFNDYHLRRYWNQMIKKISTLDTASFENAEISNTIRKAKENSWRMGNLLWQMIDGIKNSVTIFTTGIILFQFNPLYLLFITFVSIPGAFFWAKYLKKWWDFYENNQELYKVKDHSSESLTTLEQIQENRISGADKKLHLLLDDLHLKIDKKEIELRNVYYKESLGLTIVEFVNSIFSILYPLMRVLINKMSVGDFVFYIQSGQNFSSEIDAILGTFIQLSDMTVGVENIRRVFELENDIKSGNVKITKSPPKIEFKNVWFKYPNTSTYVIKGLNMTINPGEEIAIVGINGAGKTTFIKLLLRFFDVSKGKILIDGKDIKTIDLKTYYSKIGALFQDYVTYSFLSIEDGIKIARTGRNSEVTLEDALKKAEISGPINALPKKIKHRLSRSFANGVKLSTGQEQKLALARMFYRNAPVLILDEPTASIDSVSEYKIFNQIYKFIEDKTVIIISHRFSTVRNAQKIYVFENGRVIEEGSHEELLKAGGKYSHSFNLQAKGYSN